MRLMSLLHAPTSIRSRWLPWTRPTFMCSTEHPSAKIFVCPGLIFLHIYGNRPRNWRPQLITPTAKFPTSNFWLQSKMLTVGLNMGGCILWGSLLQFQQQEIDLQLVICSSKAQFILNGWCSLHTYCIETVTSAMLFLETWGSSHNTILFILRRNLI